MNRRLFTGLLHIFFILSFILASIPAAFCEPISFPTLGGELVIPYAAIASPDNSGADVTYLKPLGIGDVAIGGALFSPKVELDFAEAADLYVGLTTTVAPGKFYLLWQDGSFHDLSEGIKPWMERIDGLSSWLLDADIPYAVLQPYPGTYNFYLMAVPYGSDIQTQFPYYLWNTSFVVTPPSLALSANTIDFGTTSGPKSQDLILTNTSGYPYGLSVSLYDPTLVFGITASTCTGSLAPQQSCTVTVSVNPGAVTPGGIELVDVDISITPDADINAAASDSPVRLTIPIIARPVAATTCTYAAGNAVPATFASAGGNGSIAVTASPADCVGSWTAVSNADWITITSGGSGTAGGTVSFSVAANTLPTQRTGTITVNSVSKTITQAAQVAQGDCTNPTLTPSSKTFGSSGATSTIQLTIGTDCQWTASGFFLSPWLRVTSAPSGSGSATITYAVDAYSGSGSRVGSLYIAGKTFTATQTGSGCSYTLSPSSATLGSSAGSGQFQVTLSSTCPAVSPSLTLNADWIHLSTSNKTSTGYTIGYSVDANNSEASRSGTITVAGTKEFNITQSASGVVQPGCTYTVNPTSDSFNIAGGQKTFQVTASGSSCNWSPTSSDPTWLRVISPTTSQTAGGTVTYTVDPNNAADAPARTGYITVSGDKKVSVFQEGATDPVNGTLKYDSMQWNVSQYFSFGSVPPDGTGVSKGRPVKFIKLTVPPEGCPTGRVEFWLSTMTTNGNLLVAGPDNAFGTIENAWAVYDQKLALGPGVYERGPNYWFSFNAGSQMESILMKNANATYAGKTFYLMVVNEGPKSQTYRIEPYCF